MRFLPNVLSVHINLLWFKIGIETLVYYHQLKYLTHLKFYVSLFGIGFSYNIGRRKLND